MLKANCENQADWKKMLPSAQTQGKIYEDQGVWVTATMKQVKYLHHMTLTFFDQGGQLQNLKAELDTTYIYQSELMIQVSPVRYPPDGSPPQAVVMAMLRQPFAAMPPSLNIQYTTSSGVSGAAQIRLPIFVNRFVEAVEMPQAAFAGNWNNITHK